MGATSCSWRRLRRVRRNPRIQTVSSPARPAVRRLLAAHFSLSVGGSREQSTDWLLDGNDNNQLDEGGIAIFSTSMQSRNSRSLTYNYSAEYGERAGPTVLVTTKSGSINFMDRSLNSSATPSWMRAAISLLRREKFNLNQFGGSFGGPIKKDKTFFFVDYQAQDAATRSTVHGICSDNRR